MKEAKSYIDSFKLTRNFQDVNEKLMRDPDFRNELFLLLKETQYPYPEYVSWIAVHFFEKNKMLKNEFEMLCENVKTTNNHTVQRNSLNALNSTHFELSENGEILDKLFQILSNPQSLPANLFASLKVIENHFLVKYPELIQELKVVCSNLKEINKPSVKVMLRELDKKISVYTVGNK